MANIVYDFDIEGALQEDPFLDRYEITIMFEQTRQSLENGLNRKLGGLICDVHNEEPMVTITGRYSAETEQFEMDYHIDTCCKLFMVRVVKVLNTVN